MYILIQRLKFRLGKDLGSLSFFKIGFEDIELLFWNFNFCSQNLLFYNLEFQELEFKKKVYL